MADREAGLIARIGADDSDFQKKLKDCASAAKKLSNEMEGIGDAPNVGLELGEGFASLTPKISGAGVALSGFAGVASGGASLAVDLLVRGVYALAAGVGTLVATFGAANVAFAMFADKISDESLTTGIAIDKLVVLNQAFESIGAGSNSAGSALSAMQNSIADAVTQTESQNEQLTQLQENLSNLSSAEVPAPQLADTAAIEAEIKRLKFSRVPGPELVSTRGLKGADYETARQQNAMAREQAAARKLENRARLADLQKQLSDTKKLNGEMSRSYESGQKQRSRSIEKTQKQIEQLSAKGNAAAKAFKELGLNVLELNEMTPDQQFDALASALQKVENASKRTALARDILGQSARGIMPALLDPEPIDLAKRMVGSLAEISKKSAAEVGRMWDVLTQKPGILMKQLGGGFLKELVDSPTLKGAIEKLIDLDFGPLGEKLGKGVREIGQKIFAIFESGDITGGIVNSFKSVAQKLSDMLVSGLMTGIAVALGTLGSSHHYNKLAGGITLALIGAAVSFGEALSLSVQKAMMKLSNDMKDTWWGRSLNVASGLADLASPFTLDRMGALDRLVDGAFGKKRSPEELDKELQEFAENAAANSVGGTLMKKGLDMATQGAANTSQNMSKAVEVASRYAPGTPASAPQAERFNALNPANASAQGGGQSFTTKVDNANLKELVSETKVTNSLIQKYFEGLVVQ